MTGSLPASIFIEGLVVLVYSVWRRKPAGRILLASVLANLLTQSMLWAVLNLFFAHYLAALFISEIFIWLIEGFILHGLRANRLSLREALTLSFAMNLSSFAAGWLLPT